MVKVCFTVHRVLHDLLDKVAGNCFRIENARRESGERWEGDVPRDVQHLFIQNYDADLITRKILGLQNLRTLIVYVVEKNTLVEENVIVSICKRLPKLQVLAVAFSKEDTAIEQHRSFSFPESISLLKHQSYLSSRTRRLKLILPNTLNKLHHIQVLDFGYMALL